MRSSRLVSLLVLTFITVSAQAQGWGDHRTYGGPTYGGPVNHGPIYHGPVYGGPTYHAPVVYGRPYYHGPVYVHPIHPVYPIYRSEPSVYWRTGHWAHEWHDNRFGWWWVNGLGFSYYSAPTYPYPDPIENQTTIIYQSNDNGANSGLTPPPTPPAPIPPPYPPVNQTAPAASGNTAPPSGTGMYYFCESSQLYYPYAKTCSERWKSVPQVP